MESNLVVVLSGPRKLNLIRVINYVHSETRTHPALFERIPVSPDGVMGCLISQNSVLVVDVTKESALHQFGS